MRTGATPHLLEPHDLAVAKLAAFRDKDKGFVAALIRTGMLDVALIRDRAYMLPASLDPRVAQRVQGWLDYYDGGKGRRESPNPPLESKPPPGPEQRRPRGTPRGGEWAPRQRPEGDVTH